MGRKPILILIFIYFITVESSRLITLENYAHPSQSQGSPGLSPKVINGAKAGFGQFPWHVSLSTKKNLHWFLCGGSMISNRVVLTAAHCLYSGESTVLGFGVISSHQALILIDVGRSNFVIHPEYKGAPYLVNDIALVKYKGNDILFDEYKKYIKPINLIPSNLKDSAVRLRNSYISGMGRYDQTGKTSEYLRYTAVQVTENEVCERMYNHYDSNKLCVLGFKGSMKNTCQGDSGSPLISFSDGEWYQVGICSFSRANDNCMRGFPTGFVRVASYLDWIEAYL